MRSDERGRRLGSGREERGQQGRRRRRRRRRTEVIGGNGERAKWESVGEGHRGCGILLAHLKWS